MQIVENRRGRLSRPFLSPGDNFSKRYDENQIRAERNGVRARRAGGFKSLSPAGSNPSVRAAKSKIDEVTVIRVTESSQMDLVYLFFLLGTHIVIVLGFDVLNLVCTALCSTIRRSMYTCIPSVYGRRRWVHIKVAA